MALITNNPNIKSQFMNRWALDYVPAIIKYAKKSKMEDDDHRGGQRICFFNNSN